MTIRRTRALRDALRLFAAVAFVLLSVAGLSACGGDDDDSSGGSGGGGQAADGALIQRNADNAKTTIVVGSKNFTEQKVLGEVYAQALAAAGYKVRKELNLGDQDIALAALKSGQISGYPEYTGTALLSFLGVKAGDLPSSEQKAYEQVRDGLAKDGITALPPTPFTSSNEVGLTQETAKENGLRTISDLEGKSEQLTLYGSPECRTRSDCLLGLQEVYGLKFKKFTPVNIDQRHAVLESGQADLSIVFTTDPQIKRNRLVLLEDDRGMFPPYNSTFLVRDDVAEKAGPDLRATVEKVNENLTAEVMQELNARVDLDKDTPAEAATAYLKQFKLVS
jgi:osmoprotectant transport system substrate-binding protein